MRISAEVDATALDADAYVAEGATVAVYVDEQKKAGQYVAEDTALGTVGESIARAVDSSSDDAGAVREALENEDSVYVEVVDDAGSLTDIAEADLQDYMRVDGISDTAGAQDIMEHEYVNGFCNCCGADMDILKTDPEAEDVDAYFYDCDDCGNNGHYFGGQDTEDGSVTVWSEFTDRDDLFRTVELQEGAEVTVYDVDAANDPESLDNESILYEVELGNDWTTRPDGLLQRLVDQPIGLTDDVRDRLQEHREDPNFGVYVTDATGGSDIEHDDNDTYVKVVDTASVQFGSAHD